MMSMVSAWIAARFRQIGGALTAGPVVFGAVLLALFRVRRSGYRRGKYEAEGQAEIDRLESVVKEREDHAEINDAMREAHVSGPRSRDDVLGRLLDDED